MIKSVVDLLFTAAVLVGSVYLWVVADRFPTFAKYKNIDSDFWPKIILVSMCILSVPILYQNVAALRRKIVRKRDVPSGDGPDGTSSSSAVNWTKMTLMAALCVFYYLGLSFLGFVLSTIVFMWLAMAVIGGAKKITAIVFPIGFTAFLAIVFVKLLELSLPRGVGIFHELSLLLY